MSIATIKSDQSRWVNWAVRKQTDATLTLNVTQNSSAYNLSSTTFIAEVFDINDLTTPIITLTQSAGLTNGGAAGTLAIALTDTQLNLTPNDYYWRLRTTAPTDYLWLSGIFKVNGFTWDGGTDYTVNIALTVANNEINLELIAASIGSGFLLAANNLSDLANAATARTNLGATTVGGNIFTLPNPSAIKLIRAKADNTVEVIDPNEFIGVACSDETTVLAAASTSVPVATFHAPYALTLTRVFAGLRTAGTGAAVVIVDIHVNGTTIMDTTKILFTASVKLSANGTLSNTVIAANDYVEIFLDQRDTNNVATGLKAYLVGYKTV